MTAFQMLLSAFVFTLWCMVVNMAGVGNVLDNASLTTKVLQLQQTISDLQSQNQAQEQKQAAVLSSILSKLVLTSSTLEKMTEEHNSTLGELTSLKNEHNSTLYELSTLKGLLSNITSTPPALEHLKEEVNLTLSELRSLKEDHNATQHELATVKVLLFSQSSTSTALERLQADRNLTLTELKSLKEDHNSIMRELATVKGQLTSPTDGLVHVNSELTKLKSAHNSTTVDLATIRDQLHQTLVTCSMTNVSYHRLQGKESSVTSKLSEMIQADRNTTEKTLSVLKVQILSVITAQGNMEKEITHIDHDVDSINDNLSRAKLVSSANSRALTGLFAKLADINKDVYFEASLAPSSQRLHHYVKGATLMFSRVLQATGGGFNAVTGIFTAPVSGTYLFWINALFRDPSREGTISIKKHSLILGTGTGYTSANNTNGNVNAFAVVRLLKGNTVHFVSESAVHMVTGQSSYGGVLLHS